MENSRSALNKFLVTRDIGPVRSSLTTPWNYASERTRRYYIKKASEAVAASLEVMAPGESAEMLWSTLVNSKAIQKHFACASVEQESFDSALWSHWQNAIIMLPSGTRAVKYCPLWWTKSVLSLCNSIFQISLHIVTRLPNSTHSCMVEVVHYQSQHKGGCASLQRWLTTLFLS